MLKGWIKESKGYKFDGLMDRFKKDSDFKIGANDVSDYVYNAILDALDGYNYPEETSVKNVDVVDVKTNNYESKE